MPLLKSPIDQDFGGLLQQGMQLRTEPERLRNQLEQQKFANLLANQQSQFNAARLPFAQQMEEANIKHRLAQAKTAEQQANMPFGGQLSGVAREAFGLELLKQQYGPESEVYQNAAKRYQADLEASKILNEYRQTLSGTTEKRVATPFKKLEMEIGEINDRKDISPYEKERLTEMARAAQIKGITLPEFQKRAAFAANIDKTLESINPDHLVQYAGAFGEGKKFVSGIAASLGFTLNDFKQYQNALTATKLLAKQVRQFYGDSITPEVQAQLRELTNPASWKNNPEIAKDKFLMFKNLLLKETQTYKNLTRNTKEYGQAEYSSTMPESNKAFLENQRKEAFRKNIQPNAPSKPQSTKRFKYVNGNIVNA